jgi:hypothetical protein
VEDSGSRDYRVVASIVPEGETGYDTAHRTGVIGQVFRTEKPILLADARNHPLYDTFDSNIEWELCFPLLLKGKLDAVINLEGAGLLDVSPNTWRSIGESIIKATQHQIASAPQSDDPWRIPTTEVVVTQDQIDSSNNSVVGLARALARDGKYTLLVGDYPALLRGRSPGLADIEGSGLTASYCFYGVEPRLDLLATGTGSEESLLKTNWWDHCDGRYSFVILERPRSTSRALISNRSFRR